MSDQQQESQVNEIDVPTPVWPSRDPDHVWMGGKLVPADQVPDLPTD